MKVNFNRVENQQNPAIFPNIRCITYIRQFFPVIIGLVSEEEETAKTNYISGLQNKDTNENDREKLFCR